MAADTREMTRRIYEDIQDALAGIAGHIENPPAAVESVNVRVGQRSEAMQSVEDLDPSPFSRRNGWILDITFTPRYLTPETPTFKTMAAFPLFRHLSVKAIRGVGSTWAGRFRENRMATIGDLAEAGDVTVSALVNHFDTLHPLVCRHKAVQLDRNIPLAVVENFGDRDLGTLVRSPEEILAACSEPGMKRLVVRFLSSCAAGIDVAVLAGLRLDSLLSP